MRNKKALTILRSVQPQKMQRRVFLRGMFSGLGVTIGVPMLDIMLNGNGTALAQGGDLPMRFGVFYWGGGITHNYWVPSATGAGWVPPMSLSDFASIKSYVTVVTGYSHVNTSPGHIPMRGIALSSSHDLSKCMGDCVGTYRGQNMPEPSLDALVAETWKDQKDKKTIFPSLEIGISRKGPYKGNSSWRRGGFSYNRHIPSPMNVYNKLFSSKNIPQPGGGLIQATTAYEQSMLDAVLEDAKSLNNRLGAQDRLRMDAHLTGLRAIEHQLQLREGMPESPVGNVCPAPGAPDPTKNYGDDGSREEKEAKSKVMSELLATALACDLTRVFSYEFSATQSQAVYWEVGSNEEHHEWNHRATSSLQYAQSIQFIMKNFSYLAQKLKEKPEGAGNVLDRTLIFGTSEHANAGSHTMHDHPLLLVGRAGGRIRSGIHHRHAKPGTANSDAPKVMLTAVRAVGANVPSLGQSGGTSASRRVTTTIPDLET